MPSSLTNLLPRGRQRALTRGYFFRLLVVASSLVTAVILVHGLLLLPAYLYLGQHIEASETQLATFESSEFESTEKEVRDRAAALEARAALILEQDKRAKASGAIQTALSAPRAGIAVRGITFTPSAAAESQKMILTGTATTREALRTYMQALDALPAVARAELPISAYAKESNIDFTITLTGTLKP